MTLASEIKKASYRERICTKCFKPQYHHTGKNCVLEGKNLDLNAMAISLSALKKICEIEVIRLNSLISSKENWEKTELILYAREVWLDLRHAIGEIEKGVED